MPNRSRAQEYLERFVAEFVIIFEEYFSEYHICLLNKIPKKGYWGKLVEVLSSLGRAEEGGSVFKLESTVWVIGVLQMMANSVGVYYEEEKLKKNSMVMTELSKNPALIRDTLLKSAAIIFQAFESQFVQMEIKQDWCELDKVVHDAVNRVISYYKKNPGTEFQCSSITAALIKGESKHYHGPLLPRGHTVTINNTSVNTKDLFEKVGLKSDRSSNNAETNLNLGHRLPFDWEQSFSQYDPCSEADPQDQYCVDQEMISQAVIRVSVDIYDGLEVGKFDEALKKINQDAEKDVEKLWLLIKDNFCEVMECLDILNYELNGKVRKHVTFEEDSTAVNQSLERVWFDLNAPVEFFVGRVKELEDLHTKILRRSPSVTITAICGSGGMGKTHLARQYTYLQCTATPTEFHHVIWLNAENEKLLVDSFLRLAKRILHTPVIKGNGHYMEFVVHDVYKFLSNRRTLIIFDNVENGETLKGFLPLPFVSTCISIVLISRCNDWGKDIEKVSLSTWEHMDAEEFVKNSLAVKGTLKETSVSNLVEKLQHFPLALSMAVAYIKERRSSNVNDNINVFLKKYENERRRNTFTSITSSSDNDCPRDKFAETIFNVWNVSYRKMKNDPTSGAAVGRILNILALVSSEKVDREIFQGLYLENDEQSYLESYSEGDICMELEDSFHLLAKYAFVDGQDWQRVSINRLIQGVTRLQIMSSEQLREVTMYETFKVLQFGLLFPESEADISGNRRQLPLLETFLSHINVLGIKGPVIDDLLIFLNHMGEAYGDMGEPVMMKELYEASHKLTENYYGKINPKVASALNKLANAYEILGRPLDKKKCLENALQIQEEYYDKDNLEMIVTLNNLGNTLGKIGEYNKTVEYLERVLSILETLPTQSKAKRKKTESRVPTVLYNLAIAYGELGLYKKQRDYLEKALQMYDLHNSKGYLERACMVNNLGNAYGALGEHSKQIELYETALALRIQTHGGEDNLDVARSLHNLGIAYGDLGNHEKKKSLLERALAIENKHYGSETHIESATTLYNLGIAWGKLGDHQKKKVLLEKALGIEIRHYGEGSVKVVTTMYNLAISCRDLGDYNTSKNLLLTTLRIQEQHFKEESIDLVNTLCSLAVVYSCLQDYTNQVQVLERVLKIQSRYYKRNSLRLTSTLDYLGIAYGFLDDYYKQKECFTRSLGIRERHIESHQQEVARTLNNLGNTEFNLRYYQKAKDKYESALRKEEKLYKEEFNRMAHILNNLGHSFQKLNDHEKAKQCLKRSLAMNVEYYGKDHSVVNQAFRDLGGLYDGKGDNPCHREVETTSPCDRMQGGIKFFPSFGNSNEERLDIDKKIYWLKNTLEMDERDKGLDNIETATTIYKLGIAYGESGDHEKKLELLERALKIQELHCSRDDNEVSRTLFHLGETYGQLGIYSKQKEMLEEVLAIHEKKSITIPKLVATLDHLGNAYGLEGNLEKQKELYDSSLSIKQKYYGDHHCEVAKTLNNLGTVSYFAKDYRLAIELYEQALAIEEKLLRDGYIETAHILNNLGHCLMYLDEIQESERCLQEAMQMKMGLIKENTSETNQTVHNFETADYNNHKIPNKFLGNDLQMNGKLHRRVCPNSHLTLNKLAHLRDTLKLRNRSASKSEVGDDSKKSDFENVIKLRQLRNDFTSQGDNEKANKLDEAANNLINEYFDLPPYSHLKYLLSGSYFHDLW